MPVTSKLVLSFISFCILSILTFLFLPSITKAQAILFSDNFDDGDANGWLVEGTPGWNVNTTSEREYGIIVSGGISNTIPLIWDTAWENIVFTVDLRGVSGTDKNVILKYLDSSNLYEIHHTGNKIFFEKHIGNVVYAIAPAVPYPLANGVVYHFRFEINGSHFRIFESGHLLFDVEDSSPSFNGGKIGLRAGVSGTQVWYDNVLVTELVPSASPSPTPTPTPLPLPSLDVIDLKQFSPPWGSHVYDKATSWSNNPFISRWGCALTSAAMVLKYYGHSVDPDSLNNWLKSQPDGYIGNGLVNWLALSRYSLQNSDGSIPALEYRRLAGTVSNLTDEIVSGRPAIIGVPGHFLVAKSQTPDSFGINDPAYSDRPTLASYGNSFNSIGSYRPTHTDLSYILLTSSDNVDLAVTDSDGNLLDGYSFVEDPLTDDVDNSQSSGDPLNVFLLPVPGNGTYKVELSGNGLYDFDSYLYDENGDVSVYSKEGIVSQGAKDSFNLGIGSVNQTKPKVDINTLIKDLEAAYKQRLIRNKYVYHSLRNRLLLVKWSIEHKHRKWSLAKTLLKSFKHDLIKLSPVFVDYGVKKILLEDSSILISQL